MNALAAAIILTLAGAFTLSAQTAPTDVTRSMSGQFLVNTRAGDLRRLPPSLSTNIGLLRLEPQFVAVSAERVKQAVWRLIGFNGGWEQPIAITLQRPRTATETINVYRDHLGTRPCYRMELPAVVGRETYMRALVQTVLMEFTGRNAPGQSVEIPVWVTEGITYHLASNHGTELLLSAPRHQDNGMALDRAFAEYQQSSPMEKAHKVLVGTTPLTFEELSWPTPGQLKGNELARYQASAQVFLCSLLRLPDGATCLRNFLSSLPKHQNWQIAFLSAFAPHFKRPLDIEKWWSLEGLNFAQRDLTHTWPVTESWEKLDATLMEKVDVFVSTNQLPERSQLTLKELVTSWKTGQQKEVLERKSAELKALRLRIAPELAPLTAEYIAALDNYLRPRGVTPAMPGATRIAASVNRLNEQRLLKRLAELEAERERLRPGREDGETPTNIAKATAPVPEMRLPAFKLRAN